MKKNSRSVHAAAMRRPATLGALALAISAALFAQGSAAADAPPQNLGQAQAAVTTQSGGAFDDKAAQERDLRSKAMREAANSYGARSGLLRGNYENRLALEKVASAYDASYNFAPLMLTDLQPVEKGGDGRPRLIRPPVITKGAQSFNKLDARTVRERDLIIKIETNVEFTPAPPNWRTYLMRDLGEKVASLPHYTLMPRSSDEKKSWDGWVAEGWAIGYAQAKAIMDADLNRLQRDFDGMVMYHELVAQQLLTLPYVASRNDGVTGDDNQMNVNDVTLRISVVPAFKRRPSRWLVVPTDAQSSDAPYPGGITSVTLIEPPAKPAKKKAAAEPALPPLGATPPGLPELPTAKTSPVTGGNS